MTEPATFEVTAFGVRLHVAVAVPELVAAVRAALPPGSVPSPEQPIETSFSVEPDGAAVAVLRDGEYLGEPADPEVAVRLLEEALAAAVAVAAHDRVFIRAAVAAVDGRALVVAGPSLSGRTTLLGALVRAGATPYSDTFAVLDPAGLVHPYLPGRGEDPLPVPVAVIASAPYRPGARWAPVERAPGDGALALLGSAVAGTAAPAELLPLCGRVAAGALVLDGERGAADEAARALLSALSARLAPA